LKGILTKLGIFGAWIECERKSFSANKKRKKKSPKMKEMQSKINFAHYFHYFFN